jgi:hypothetical protein
MLATLIIVARMFVTAAAAPCPVDTVRTIVSDGSVWADVGGSDGQIVASYRLADADEHTRWIVLDVDGDGHSDVVAVAFDAISAPRVAAWRNAGSDGFQPLPLEAAPVRVAQNGAHFPATL